jgi:hypothetical protein
MPPMLATCDDPDKAGDQGLGDRLRRACRGVRPWKMRCWLAMLADSLLVA